MQFLLTAIVAVILLVGEESSCSSVYNCTSNNNLNATTSKVVHVNCSSRGLHSIPGNLSTNTYVLNLTHNEISVIEDNDFSNLPSLQYLDLHQNKITSIKSDTFNNLAKLKVLYLHENRITSIESNTFNNFLNLKRIDLDNNEISVIEDNNFNNLPNLEYLYLHQNRITSIKSDMFNNLTKVYHLYLQNNPISVVEKNAFNMLPNLKELKFHMYCASCDNIPFWRWLRREWTLRTYIHCNDFHGRKLSSLRNFNYDCTANDGNGSVWCSRHGDWTCLKYMFFMISLQYIMS